MRRSRFASVLCMGAVSLSAFAAAPEHAPVSNRAAGETWLQRAIQRLDAPTLREREAATEEIAEADTVSLSQLTAALRSTAISAEQRIRLTRLAWERFVRSPRAALGIQFQTRFMGGEEGGAVIDTTFEGFDCHNVLKSGDVIYAMDDLRIMNMEDGKRVIQSHDPGDRITLRIFRNGEPLIARVALGSIQDLDNRRPNANVAQQRYATDYSVLPDAFRIRLRHQGQLDQLMSVPIDLERYWKGLKVTPTKIIPARGPDQMVMTPDGQVAAEKPPPSSISAGGMQRSVEEAGFAYFSTESSPSRARASAIVAQLSHLQAQSERAQLILVDPARPMQERMRASQERMRIDQQIAQLKLQLETMRAGGVEP